MNVYHRLIAVLTLALLLAAPIPTSAAPPQPANTAPLLTPARVEYDADTRSAYYRIGGTEIQVLLWHPICKLCYHYHDSTYNNPR